MPKIDSGAIVGHKITAVIVTHNPQLDVLSGIVGQLTSQVESIIVVDNNSGIQDQIKQISDDIEYCLLSANVGLGKAHNLGIEYAKSRSNDYVLILDQDSLPDANMVKEMLKVAQTLSQQNKLFCAIGSRYRDEHGHLSEFVKIDWFRFARNTCINQSLVEADFLISSGSLIPLSAIDEIGFMDESLFIDHIDTEWFMRAKNLGYNAYGACKAVMSHGLGEKTTRIWFARWRNVPYHHAFRYYYIFRNSILLYKRRYMPFKWMLADWVRLGQILFFFGLFTGDRFANLKMIGKGIVDGIKGKTGRNDTLTPA